MGPLPDDNDGSASDVARPLLPTEQTALEAKDVRVPAMAVAEHCDTAIAEAVTTGQAAWRLRPRPLAQAAETCALALDMFPPAAKSHKVVLVDLDGSGSSDELLKKAGEMLLHHAHEPAVQNDVSGVLQSNDSRIACPVEGRSVQLVEDGLALEN